MTTRQQRLRRGLVEGRHKEPVHIRSERRNQAGVRTVCARFLRARVTTAQWFGQAAVRGDARRSALQTRQNGHRSAVREIDWIFQ